MSRPSSRPTAQQRILAGMADRAENRSASRRNRSGTATAQLAWPQRARRTPLARGRSPEPRAEPPHPLPAAPLVARGRDDQIDRELAPSLPAALALAIRLAVEARAGSHLIVTLGSEP